MKLTKTRYGYCCASDPRLQFHGRVSRCGRRQGRWWAVRLKARRGKHFFGTLAEASGWARQHWRPYFMRRIIDRLAGTGRRLWEEAREGDATSFHVLLDWLDENLGPTWHPSERAFLLREAKWSGLWQPRQRRRSTVISCAASSGSGVRSRRR